MIKLFFLNLVLLLFLAFNIANAQNKKLDTPPSSWKKLEVCGLTFFAPADLKDEGRGIPFDSCGRSYRSKTIILSVDVVRYGVQESDDIKYHYSDEKSFRIFKTRIDGRESEIATYYETENLERRKDLFYNAILFVPSFEKVGDSLTIWANSHSEKDREIVKKIFGTVRFGE